MPEQEDPRIYWRRVREHYRRAERLILASPANRWAIDRYAWDHEAHISLTPIEAALWSDICAERCVLYPQYPVGRYIVDFGNPVARVAVECDGAAFHTDAAKDRARQAEIEAQGWTVYRITGRDCLGDFEEHEDPDTGRVTHIPSPARLLIRAICERHPIQYSGSSKGPRLIGELAAERMQRHAMRAVQA